MQANTTIEISVKGRPVSVPSVQVNGRTLYAAGGWLKIASVRDEAWLDGEAVPDPVLAIEKIREGGLNADLFTFPQRLPHPEKRFDYPFLWDNVASINTQNFTEWWEKKLPQETRKNVRRSVKRGVTVREVEFSDDLVRKIVEINNEAPIRQGRPFWHYGKPFEVVKKDYLGLNDRAIYIGAFHGEDLIGFIKLILMGEIAGILQIVCMNKHQDKRPANALVTKAVELCAARNLKFMVYGKYVYGNSTKSPLTEFKRRNGFEQTMIPRYYVPLTLKGRLALALGLHLSFKRFIPGDLHFFLGNLRARWYQKSAGDSNASEEKSEGQSQGQTEGQSEGRAEGKSEAGNDRKAQGKPPANAAVKTGTQGKGQAKPEAKLEPKLGPKVEGKVELKPGGGAGSAE